MKKLLQIASLATILSTNPSSASPTYPEAGFTQALTSRSLIAQAAPQVNIDTDKDGVQDVNDDCPNTPENTTVNDKGCPAITPPTPVKKPETKTGPNELADVPVRVELKKVSDQRRTLELLDAEGNPVRFLQIDVGYFENSTEGGRLKKQYYTANGTIYASANCQLDTPSGFQQTDGRFGRMTVLTVSADKPLTDIKVWLRAAGETDYKKDGETETRIDKLTAEIYQSLIDLKYDFPVTLTYITPAEDASLELDDQATRINIDRELSSATIETSSPENVDYLVDRYDYEVLDNGDIIIKLRLTMPVDSNPQEIKLVEAERADHVDQVADNLKSPSIISSSNGDSITISLTHMASWANGSLDPRDNSNPDTSVLIENSEVENSADLRSLQTAITEGEALMDKKYFDIIVRPESHGLAGQEARVRSVYNPSLRYYENLVQDLDGNNHKRVRLEITLEKSDEEMFYNENGEIVEKDPRLKRLARSFILGLHEDDLATGLFYVGGGGHYTLQTLTDLNGYGLDNYSSPYSGTEFNLGTIFQREFSFLNLKSGLELSRTTENPQNISAENLAFPVKAYELSGLLLKELDSGTHHTIQIGLKTGAGIDQVKDRQEYLGWTSTGFHLDGVVRLDIKIPGPATMQERFQVGLEFDAGIFDSFYFANRPNIQVGDFSLTFNLSKPF